MDDAPATWSDDELVARLRAGSERAATELFARFAPLLREEARRRRVPPPHDAELAGDVLASAAMLLRRAGAAVPRSLAGYLVAALRRRALNLVRAERRAAAREAALEGELASRVDPAPTGDEADASPAAPLLALAAHLDATLDDGDRQLLHWLGDYVPQREMAAWLGVTHGAVRTRVSRLRQRLRAAAARWAATRDAPERRAIERFLQRVAPALPDAPSTPTARVPRGRSPHGPST